MISDNQSICPKCGGQLKYYDHVQRLVRTKFGNKKWVAIRRLRCCKCHAVHRELPDFIFPYKQYESDIIIGVLEGLITCETLGFEDLLRILRIWVMQALTALSMPLQMLIPV